MGSNKLSDAAKMVGPLADACVTDMEKLCNNVTPGENRMLACLYNHVKELSESCEKSLLGADPKMKEAAAEMAFAITECIDDLVNLCPDIQPGDKRYFECLRKNDSEVSTTCKEAIKKVGYE